MNSGDSSHRLSRPIPSENIFQDGLVTRLPYAGIWPPVFSVRGGLPGTSICRRSRRPCREYGNVGLKPRTSPKVWIAMTAPGTIAPVGHGTNRLSCLQTAHLSGDLYSGYPVEAQYRTAPMTCDARSAAFKEQGLPPIFKAFHWLYDGANR